METARQLACRLPKRKSGKYILLNVLISTAIQLPIISAPISFCVTLLSFFIKYAVHIAAVMCKFDVLAYLDLFLLDLRKLTA
jgi:hypothetical protein